MKRTALFAMLGVSPVLLAASMVPASTGTWKIEGDVQGTPVRMTCVLTEAEHKLTGNCIGAAGDMKPRVLAGEVKEEGTVSWHFDTEYEGNPITVSMAGKLIEDGAKMSGTMYVDPMQVDGTFFAVKQPDVAPAAKE
jgi:hypothetical protein